MMKLKYLICNHKNKLTYNELKKYTNGLKNIDTSKVKFIVCPSLIKYVLIGHAERRKYLKENNEVLIRKIKMANKNDIKVIYCVTEEESDLDSAKRKIKEYIDSVNLYLKDDAIIAYEPIWAIGNDLELDYNYINEIISYIKELTNKEVIYGGSVNEKNIDNFINNPQIEGFLISNSGLDLDKLSQIINKMS